MFKYKTNLIQLQAQITVSLKVLKQKRSFTLFFTQDFVRTHYTVLYVVDGQLY